MAALDWEKIDLNATVDEEQLCEWLAAVQEQVQEMARESGLEQVGSDFWSSRASTGIGRK